MSSKDGVQLAADRLAKHKNVAEMSGAVFSWEFFIVSKWLSVDYHHQNVKA